MTIISEKIVVFAGTRPEIIKLAPVIRALRVSGREVCFCFTGQHQELAKPFLHFFDLKPNATLDLMVPGQSLGQLSSRAMLEIDRWLKKSAPIAAVLVQGDTTTALTGALSAFYHQIPVGHVEAGLRTSSIHEPFPEELNRRLIGQIAKWHFAPTERARKNLLQEGKADSEIFVTGNTGVDSILWSLERLLKPAHLALQNLTAQKLVLVTAHRRENFGEPFTRIVEAVARLAREFADFTFVWPVHKNPRVEEALPPLKNIPNVLLTDPLDYSDTLWVFSRAQLVLSDSGGIQEEAPTLKVPVLVLRNETERPEAIEYGTSFLVGTDAEKIFQLGAAFLRKERILKLSGDNPYGDGRAAERIAEILCRKI